MTTEQRIGYALALRDMNEIAKRLTESGKHNEAAVIAAAVTFLLLDIVEQAVEANSEKV